MLVIIFIITVCFIGCVSNAASFRFYWQSKVSSTSNFLMTPISLIDCITCVCFSLNTVILIKSATFTNMTFCQFIVYSRVTLATCSFCIVLLIGIDRFLTMYASSSSPKLSMKEAKIFTVGFIVFSFGFAVPDLYVTGIVEYKVEIATNVILKGHYCTDLDDYKNVRQNHSIVKAATILIISAALVVMYALIARKIGTSVQGKDRTNVASPIRKECQTEVTDSETVNQQNPFIDNTVETYTTDTSNSQKDTYDCSNRRNITRVYKLNRQTLVQRITVQAFLMTLVSIGSVIPLSVIKLASPLKKYEYPLWMSFLYHTYLLRSCANPFIIGFCNRKFRQYCKEILCHFCFKLRLHN
ncbi:hypothetical protein DPMN_158036 [Dreissena polymorpha]|uniref:G-protein coupled receptors family 1 profile domain-containing protein n=1 Tax=Dreissena polymorpha TaxID=45954 RepID=A0A9D4ELL4_DREPO|nr:hypothetical protein DPMN_158036 [Dreissena polymorpha]